MNTTNTPQFAYWGSTPWSVEYFLSSDTKHQLVYLCSLAHLAPSTHNTQPWRFNIDSASQQITMMLDRTFVLPASDTIGRQAGISLGCALEHLLIAGKHYGMNATILLEERPTMLPRDPSEEQYSTIATIHFEKTTPSQQRLLPAMFTRKIQRGELDPAKPIDSIVTQDLDSLSQEGITLHVIADKMRKKSVAEFQGQADGFVMNSKKFSRELGEWLLPNDSTSGLGMPGSNFGLQDAQAFRIHKGLLGEGPLHPEDTLKFALAGKDGIEKAAFVGFLTAKADDFSHWIATGRSLARYLLHFESHGIATAINAGIVEVTLVNKMFAMTLGTFQRITALFRAGHLRNEEDKTRPHAPRLLIQDILL